MERLILFKQFPRWVEVGAFGLASIAGCINAISLLDFNHQGVSHLTGSSTLLGVSMAQLEYAQSLHLLFIIAAFMLGAALSGFMLNGAVLRLGRSYSLALLLEAVLIVLAMWALESSSKTGHFLASAACGLQNGMVSTYSGATIRTTHVSGLFTDLGTMLGARLRGHPIDSRKAVLFLLLIAGFIAGGSVGTIGFQHWQSAALLIPAAAALMLALVYSIYLYLLNSQNR
jgi:uncharacterized membrane protein YoaK (UPF0700 family)